MTGISTQGPGGAGLDRLNGLPADRAQAELRTCCASRRWAAAVADGRPYSTRAALLEAAESAWWALGEDDWHEAFAAHPGIGEGGRGDPAARREQAGAQRAAPGTAAALAAGNRLYEERFGRVFLVFASGKTADEMLAELHRRLGGDPAAELRAAAGEQPKITRLRLERLLG